MVAFGDKVPKAVQAAATLIEKAVRCLQRPARPGQLCLLQSLLACLRRSTCHPADCIAHESSRLLRYVVQRFRPEGSATQAPHRSAPKAVRF